VNLDLLIVVLYSYIFGSIPFGLIITKIFLKKDIRNLGSGNIGATNVFRTGNKILASLTLLLDTFKGYFVIFITTIYFIDLIYLAAIICFLGHVFPIWIKFKGGKGVATYLGVILSLYFQLGLLFIISWLLILVIFRYSSLSSIFSTFFVFLYSLILNNFSLSSFLFTMLIIIIFTHRENITRMKNKKENKVSF
jgi:acyl phosphate:glycerol-3-phosphate acyltransferase|tara:strand:+ start:2273 stop:2854 length:582 start_codon:yes stop_codon:yes gene_type:complete